MVKADLSWQISLSAHTCTEEALANTLARNGPRRCSVADVWLSVTGLKENRAVIYGESGP